MPRLPSGAPSGRPPRTSRDDILAAAHRLIDRDGWEQLTIRRLAAEIQTSPATVYYHVRDKQDLLIQLLNDNADQTLQVELPADPRERIIAATTAIHDSLAASPWAAEVLTADGFLGLLGESALRMVEAIVAAASASGCSPERAVEVFRSLWYYSVGEILVRARSSRGRVGADRPTFFRSLDAAEMPHLAALGDRWPSLAAQDSYPEALRAFVAGLLAPVGESAGS